MTTHLLAEIPEILGNESTERISLSQNLLHNKRNKNMEINAEVCEEPSDFWPFKIPENFVEES